jgi:hypothetical protein
MKILIAGLMLWAINGCAFLGQAAELSGKMVWKTCELPQANRQQVKLAVEGEAQAQCVNDGTFTVVECQSIALSFGCPQDVVVP